MEALSWLWWLVAKLVSFVWAVVWFLLGGWVVTLAQLGVSAFLIFGYKYGWRQALPEMLTRAGPLGGYLWGWVRTRVPMPLPRPPGVSEKWPRRVNSPRSGRVREPGDVNLSTLLSVTALAGILLAIAI